MRTNLPSGTPVELARPSEVTGPGLVLLPDIGGLRPLFDGIVEQLANRLGAPVAAPEPWPGREHLTIEERLAAVGGLSSDAVMADAEAAADLVGTDEVDVAGFCMGGMFALVAGARPRFRRAVSFYGMIRIPEQWRSDTLVEPLAALGAASADVLAVVGTADPWTPSDDVAALEAVSGVSVVRYEGADHGFVHDPDRPSHRPDDAVDAWDQMVGHLRR